MEKTSVKVLHIVPGFLFGGIESRLIDWYSCMDRDAIQFDVIKVTPDAPNPLVDQIQAMGGHVFSIPPLGIKTAIRHFRLIKSIMQKTQYDVVHSHSCAYGLYPLFLAKKMGIKLRILHSRTTNYNPGDKHVFISKAMGKAAVPLATKYFACSEEAGIWAFRGHSVEVIKNGIFLDTFALDEQNRIQKRQKLQLETAFVLGYVGRFSTQKNVPFLLEILKRVVEVHSNTILVMVGEDQGKVANQFKQSAQEMGLEKHILYAGRQDHVQEWYQTFDVFLLPSHFEGFGTVTIEAQASGLPCIVSTGVPKSVKVTEEVSFLDTTDPIPWVEKCLSYVGKARNPGDIERIREAGYDVKTTANKLKALYLSAKDTRS